MSSWSHRHVLDLAAFSLDDYATVLSLAQRFRALPVAGARKLPALQGRLMTSLFFEPSTRTRSSFELAAKRLSADVQSFSPSSSSLSKGDSTAALKQATISCDHKKWLESIPKAALPLGAAQKPGGSAP